MTTLTASKPTVSTANRSAGRFYYPEIDGLRLLAFLLVFIHHMQMPNLSLLGDSAAARGLSLALIETNASGWIGVDLFFVVSGFLISSILLRERDLTGKISLSQFYKRRACRIFPVYYLILGLAAILAFMAHEQSVQKIGANFAVFAAFIGNFGMAWHAITPLVAYTAFWSVCVEEQFYLAWGWALKKVRDLESLYKPIFCIYLGGIALRTALALMHPTAFRQYYFNSLTHLDGLLCGVLLALYADKWTRWLAEDKGLTKAVQCLSFVLIAATVMLGRSKAILLTLVPPLWAVVVATTIIGGSAIFRHPVITALGRRTYSAYLWQMACFLYMTPAIARTFPNLHGYIWLFVLAAILALSELTWRFVEKPFLNRKRKYAIIESGAIS